MPFSQFHQAPCDKYLLPAKFKKIHVLYNLHPVAGCKHVVVVDDYFGVIRLHALGLPVVALMGPTISTEQVELLVAAAGIKALTRRVRRRCRSAFLCSPVAYLSESPSCRTA